jgi:flavin reductase (DIM6/NTAB) family NADH-FMN oxidoreductase RutF
MKEIAAQQIDACWRGPEKAVLVSSLDQQGRKNLIAVGWLMRASMEPPVYAIGLNQKSQSGRNIIETGEFAIGVPGADLASQLMYCGTHSGAEVDKFAETGLTALPAQTIGAPLIKECLANLECRVIASQELGDHRVFFGQVQTCWWDEARSDEPELLVVGGAGHYDIAFEQKGFRLGTVRR